MLWAKLSAMSCSLWLGRLLGLQPRGRNGKGQLPLQSGPPVSLHHFRSRRSWGLPRGLWLTMPWTA